jgi:SAM-dependent methyltransferase
VSLLDIKPSDRVLEIGFGPGLAIAEASRLASDGVVCGADHSEAMVRQASKRNADAIRAGRVDLRLGSAEDLPDFGEPFDKAYAVNTMGFWREPVACLRALRSAMRAGGTIAIASQPRGPRATATFADEAPREIEAKLREAGFSGCKVERLDLDPVVICVLATIPR